MILLYQQRILQKLGNQVRRKTADENSFPNIPDLDRFAQLDIAQYITERIVFISRRHRFIFSQRIFPFNIVPPLFFQNINGLDSKFTANNLKPFLYVIFENRQSICKLLASPNTKKHCLIKISLKSGAPGMISAMTNCLITRIDNIRFFQLKQILKRQNILIFTWPSVCQLIAKKHPSN